MHGQHKTAHVQTRVGTANVVGELGFHHKQRNHREAIFSNQHLSATRLPRFEIAVFRLQANVLFPLAAMTAEFRTSCEPYAKL